MNEGMTLDIRMRCGYRVFLVTIFVCHCSGNPSVKYGNSEDILHLEPIDYEQGLSNESEIALGSDVCPHDAIENDQYMLLPNDEVLVLDKNETYGPNEYELIGGRLCITKKDVIQRRGTRILTCKKWIYDPDEFVVLKNGSVLLYDEIIEDYEIHGQSLHTCADEDVSYAEGISTGQILIYIGRTGIVISVIALIVHLIVFCMVPSLHNLPGYNLTALSLAFLFAYLFILIGQIPEVLGTSCIVSAALVHYFFLAAFFWMNVMSFDVWRALRLATKKLVSTTGKFRLKKCICYHVYAWGLPMIITITSVVIDQSESVPEFIKPSYGKDDVCWINADSAKLIFFAGPAFFLFVVNGIFFVASTIIILTNTMKNPGDQHKVAKRNLILYIRLGVIMGVTWMFGVVSALVKQEVLWFIFDILNSLQGLFVFLFFPCSRKAWRLIMKRPEIETTRSTTFQNSSSVK